MKRKDLKYTVTFEIEGQPGEKTKAEIIEHVRSKNKKKGA